MSGETRQKLLQAAQSFCDAFANQKPPEEIFSHFSCSEDVRVFEHGLPKFALFVGREFKGQGGLHNYFNYISSSLKYEKMKFENFIVDAESMQVSCRGHACFIWSSTNQGWDETFAYMLGFDDQFKVKSYEIWADTGAAYLASRGQLES